jgi:flavin reductase (DIM6/NTAB) family NADH-FMN oxidoreductase RutF
MKITTATMDSWERFYRANFVNSLSGYKAASLIGTVNEQGQPNLAIFSNLVHLGADPALVGHVNRPVEAAPHTLDNIRATGVYTINHILPGWVPKAHQTSAKYPAHVNEFEAVGLTAEYVDHVRAPFVKEARVKFALSLQTIIPIELNQTFFVIGKIEHVLVADDLVEPDGFVALERAGSVCSTGLDAYYLPQPLGRYAYAKANLPPRRLDEPR